MSSSLSILADDIVNGGTKHVFGVLGSGSSLELVDQLISRGISFHSVRFEGCAAIMAGTLGYLTGVAGLAVTIKGPGLANLLPGMAVCHFENFPMVALTEAFPRNIEPVKFHKRIDHALLCSPLIKGSVFNIRDYKEASQLSLEEIPGPTLLELVEGESLKHFTDTEHHNGNGEIGHIVEKSNRPLVIVGSLGIRENLAKKLAKLRIPVFTTVSAKGAIDEQLDHAAGIYTGVGGEYAPENLILEKADLVIGIGLQNKEVLSVNQLNCKSINIDKVVGDKGFDFDMQYQYEEVASLFHSLTNKSWGTEFVEESKKMLLKHFESMPFLPPLIFRIINKSLGPDTRLVVDTGDFCTVAEHLWTTTKPKHFLSSGNARFMGTGIPMAIGACFSDQRVPTVVAVGDGGIGPFITELEIAVQHKLPLLILLLSDGGHGSVRSRAIKDGLSQEPLLVGIESWLPIVQGLGIPGYSVSNEKSFANVFSKWKWIDGPSFIECKFDPDDYQNMVTGIRAR